MNATKPWSMLAATILMLVIWNVPLAAAEAGYPKTITIDQLKSMLANPRLTIVDVRVGSSWSNSHRKIVGAFRGNPENPDEWASKLPKNRTLVFYCS